MLEIQQYQTYYFPLIHWSEATMANISGRAVQLASRYINIIERLERGESSVSDEERQDAHDELIDELQRCGIQDIGIDFDGRANARQMAYKIHQWLRELD